MKALKFAIPLCVALAYGSTSAWAAPILGSELSSFAVLGASTVTNTGATTLIGNLGVSPGTAITGKATIMVNGTNAGIIGNPSVHEADAFAILAQNELVSAQTILGLMGPGTLLPADLVGLVLFPGVYTVPAGVSNLTGALTLDGQGNANAVWVFQMPSTLITSPGSVVNVINTGSGAGVYWNVGSSATLDSTTSFEGNILASASISLNHAAKIGCGRALAQTAAVTMDNNSINALGCETGSGGTGSNGYSGGLDVTTSPEGSLQVSILPYAPLTDVPEPGSFLLFGVGLAGLFGFRKKLFGIA